MAHQKGEEVYLQLHEVYYDNDGVPNSCTENGTTIGGDTMEEIQWVLEKIEACAKKPIIWYGDKFPNEYIN
jgi:hypothetical protein